jgi:hypothetical protein
MEGMEGVGCGAEEGGKDEDEDGDEVAKVDGGDEEGDLCVRRLWR